MSKKQHIKTINPFFIKGASPLTTNFFLPSEAKIPPILNIDTEAHFCEENKPAPEPKED